MLKQYQPFRVFLSLVVFGYLLTEEIKVFAPAFPEFTQRSTRQNNQWVLAEMVFATQVTIVASILTYVISGLIIKYLYIPVMNKYQHWAAEEQEEEGGP